MPTTFTPRYETPAALRAAFFACKKSLANERGTVRGINMSTILTILIQHTGRFAEYYASDLLLDLREVDKLISQPVDFDDSIVTFAIRRSGVDHNRWFMTRLTTRLAAGMGSKQVAPSSKYRSVLALRIVVIGEQVFAELKDITDECIVIDEGSETKEAANPVTDAELFTINNSDRVVRSIAFEHREDGNCFVTNTIPLSELPDGDDEKEFFATFDDTGSDTYKCICERSASSEYFDAEEVYTLPSKADCDTVLVGRNEETMRRIRIRKNSSF